MRRNAMFVAGALLFGLPQLVVAQEEPPSEAAPVEGAPYCPPGTTPMVPAQQAPMPQAAPVYRPARAKPAWSPYQQSLTVGGGVADFVRDRINANTGIAGLWEVRYLVGTRSYLGFEGNYTGTAAGVNGASVPGGVDPGNVITHQVAGSLRLNATRSRFQPFLTAGAGWQHLRLTGSGPVGEVTFDARANSFVAPFGAGISGYIGRHFVVDARGTYDLITKKGFTTGGARPDMWTAQLRLGYAF